MVSNTETYSYLVQHLTLYALLGVAFRNYIFFPERVFVLYVSKSK